MQRSSKSVLLRIAFVVAMSGSVFASGCTRGGAQLAFGALKVATTVAQIATVAAILSYHDSHYHWRDCGHRSRYYEGHDVYWYDDHWEYYDYGTGAWYAY